MSEGSEPFLKFFFFLGYMLVRIDTTFAQSLNVSEQL